MVRREQEEAQADITGIWSAGFRLVALYGAPTVISLGVVGWMALRLNNDLRDRQVEHTQIMHQIDAVDDHVLENRQIYLREIERTRGMLYRLCIQGSMTAHEIAVCNFNEDPDQRPRPERPRDEPATPKRTPTPGFGR